MAKATKKLGFNLLCTLEDFDHPDMAAAMEQVYPEAVEYVIRDETVTDEVVIPVGQRRRKRWEIANAVRALEAFGAVRHDARVLGVGAGKERTGFWLSNFVGEVHTTDIYADGKKPWQGAPLEMLIAPQRHSPILTNPQRMVVQHMDARELRYPDGWFDGIFSSSAIEHFGSLTDIADAAAEMGRVLKPGGVLTLSTEFKTEGEGHGWPGVVLFDTEMLHEYVIGPSGCEPVDKLNTRVTKATQDTRLVLSKAAAISGEWERPHILFINKGQTFTSIFLTLRKPE